MRHFCFLNETFQLDSVISLVTFELPITEVEVLSPKYQIIMLKLTIY